MTALQLEPKQHLENVEPHGSYHLNKVDKAVLGAVRAGLSFGVLKKAFSNFWDSHHEDTPVDIEYHGVKLRLQPKHSTIESKILLTSKLREKKELAAIKSMLTDGGVFLDVGANIGYYSIMAAHLGASKVIAIEPNPTAYNRLLVNVGLNAFKQKIILYPFGIGQEVSELVLTVCDRDLGSSSMCNDNVSGERKVIQIVPLMDILKKEKIARVDVLKIDVEGMEDRALFPYFKEIEKQAYPKMIIIEDNKSLWREDILSWLLKNGYEVALETRSNLVLKLKG